MVICERRNLNKVNEFWLKSTRVKYCNKLDASGFLRFIESIDIASGTTSMKPVDDDVAMIS